MEAISFSYQRHSILNARINDELMIQAQVRNILCKQGKLRQTSK